MQSGAAWLGQLPIDVRVGVTGHRWIPATDQGIAHVVRAALTQVMAATQIPLAATEIGLTVVSALAEGADRLVANVALELGARLEVVLPLQATEYEKDFRRFGSRAEFRMLRDQAAAVSVVSQPSGRDDNYLRAGRAIVERVDVLVAIYDGKPARGNGGTAQIVQYAKALNVPTIQLRADRDDPHIAVYPSDPAPDLSNVPLAPRALRQLDAFNAAALTATEQAVALDKLADSPGNVWLPYFVRSDTLALRYQRRNRLSVTLLYLLSALAVAVAGTQLVYLANHPEAAWVEVAILVALLTDVVITRRRGLLSKWTSARYIAERTRSAMILSAAGAVPAFALVPTGGGIHGWEQDDWAGRTVRELWFRLSASNGGSTRGEIDRQWVEEQIVYHRTTHARSSKLHRVTTWIAGALFLASLVAAILHGLHVEDLSAAVEWISVVVPAIAAAMSGYLAHREVRRQAMRSQRVLQDLTKIQSVMEAAPTTDLAPFVEQLDSVLNNDATDWYMTARLHEPELS
jgi:hypothetical protein